MKALHLCSAPLRTLSLHHPLHRCVRGFRSEAVEALQDEVHNGLHMSLARNKNAARPLPPLERPWGWNVQNTPGTNYLGLQRSQADVEVHVVVPLGVKDHTLQGGSCAEVFEFSTIVCTERGAVRYECMSTECMLRVVTVRSFAGAFAPQAFSALPSPSLDAAYHIPDFEDQSDPVLRAHHALLSGLGITSSFLDYLASLIQYKDCAETTSWYARLATFSTEGVPTVGRIGIEMGGGGGGVLEE